jgi:hypothetical protein
VTRWGKAGERLDPVEAEQRRRRKTAERARAEIARVKDDERAHESWRVGKIVPSRITMVLDAKSLYGPEVDVACGGVEPMVDEWEAGTRYPTWEQLKALAALTGVTPRYFTWNDHQIHLGPTTMRFHVRNLPPEKPPVMEFTYEAIAAVEGTEPPAPKVAELKRMQLAAPAATDPHNEGFLF